MRKCPDCKYFESLSKVDRMLQFELRDSHPVQRFVGRCGIDGSRRGGFDYCSRFTKKEEKNG